MIHNIDRQILNESRISLFDFTKNYFKYENPDEEFQYNDNTKKMYDTIQKLLLNKLPDGKTKMILNIPPRVGKTVCGIFAVAWQYGLVPNSQNILASYNDKLARGFSSQIRTIMESDFYKKVFPVNRKFKRDTNAKDLFSLDAYNYSTTRSCSTGSGITGFGCGKADEVFKGFMLIDDPNAPDSSNNKFDDVYKVYQEKLKTRLNGAKTPILIIQQRLSHHDLSGKLLDPDINPNYKDWHHLSIKAKCTETGRLNFPAVLPEEKIQELQKENNFVYQAQYQQTPIDVNLVKLFDRTKYQTYTSVPALTSYYITTDFALTAKQTADYTSIVILGEKNNKFYIVESYINKVSVMEWLEVLKGFYNTYNIQKCFIEAGTIYQAVYQQIEEKIQGIKIEECKLKGDKVARAQKLATIYQDNRIFFPESFQDEEKKQLFNFPSPQYHDDLVDALTLGVNNIKTADKQKRPDTVFIVRD